MSKLMESERNFKDAAHVKQGQNLFGKNSNQARMKNGKKYPPGYKPPDKN